MLYLSLIHISCAFAASELRARAKKQIESLRTDFLLCTGEEYAADRRRAAPLVAALVRVTQQFADACFAAKCEEKLLDYADFEHLTLDLLLTPDNQRTPLCRTVSSHYSVSYTHLDVYKRQALARWRPLPSVPPCRSMVP